MISRDTGEGERLERIRIQEEEMVEKVEGENQEGWKWKENCSLVRIYNLLNRHEKAQEIVILFRVQIPENKKYKSG